MPTGSRAWYSRERLPEDLRAEPLLAVRQRLQELGHELSQVQQRRAAAGKDALCAKMLFEIVQCNECAVMVSQAPPSDMTWQLR